MHELIFQRLISERVDDESSTGWHWHTRDAQPGETPTSTVVTTAEQWELVEAARDAIRSGGVVPPNAWEVETVYEALCDDLGPGPEDWMMDLTPSGGPCIFGTRAQLDEVGVWPVVRYQAKAPGIEDVFNGLAERAIAAGCDVLPGGADDQAALAHSHRMFRDRALTGGLTEDEAERVAIRRTLTEIAQLKRRWSASPIEESHA